MLPPAPDPSRNKGPERNPYSGLLIHSVVTSPVVSGRGIMGAGASKSPFAKRSLRVLHQILAAASSRKGGGLVNLSWRQASHS